MQTELQKKPTSHQHIPFDFNRRKSPLVLLVENDCGKREMLRDLLELYNIKVLEARTGEEAVDLTVRSRPDLVLMNAKLPLLDGFEAARLIRAIKSLNLTPIVFLSNRTERTFRKKAFAVGGNSYHIEPLDLERLDAILENFLFSQSRQTFR